ncbi:F0F1 ATP synthase subunit delta [Candidatus Daviesbacteria bacterium]|nr:F0F1 ATP synthase subunit delta [Candidatus Daviesbacteria bacterium]
MTQQVLDQILAETYTQTEALDKLRVLKELAVTELFGHGAKESNQTDFLKNFNRDNVYQIFDELEKEIRTIKPLTIFFPFEMSAAELTKVGKYLRSKFGSSFLFEARIDPNLIAGVALVWNGVYKDYSVRQKIADNQDKILAVLQEYIKH